MVEYEGPGVELEENGMIKYCKYREDCTKCMIREIEEEKAPK